MVLSLDGNSEHIAHARRKIGLFREKIYSGYNQMTLENRIRKSISLLRTYYWVTIKYKYHAGMETLSALWKCYQENTGWPITNCIFRIGCVVVKPEGDPLEDDEHTEEGNSAL